MKDHECGFFCEECSPKGNPIYEKTHPTMSDRFNERFVQTETSGPKPFKIDDIKSFIEEEKARWKEEHEQELEALRDEIIETIELLE